MRGIGGSVDGTATVGRAPTGKARLAAAIGDRRRGNALCGRRADSSAFEYTRRAAKLQAFRGNFFAETGSENAPKRKRTANSRAGRSRRGVWARRRDGCGVEGNATRLQVGDAANFSTFFRFWGAGRTPGVQG